MWPIEITTEQAENVVSSIHATHKIKKYKRQGERKKHNNRNLPLVVFVI
jgi:hypothetical protein